MVPVAPIDIATHDFYHVVCVLGRLGARDFIARWRQWLRPCQDFFLDFLEGLRGVCGVLHGLERWIDERFDGAGNCQLFRAEHSMGILSSDGMVSITAVENEYFFHNQDVSSPSIASL